MLWCMVQSYKNESKSQLISPRLREILAVMYGTKLQKWEQITTQWLQFHQLYSCDVWYKVTKMRANHNVQDYLRFRWMLWCMVQSYKNESKSQPIDFPIYEASELWCMVQSYKNESKSQLVIIIPPLQIAVMYGTKLQKWEQITTQTFKYIRSISCDVWYKVTKMRANHNVVAVT